MAVTVIPRQDRERISVLQFTAGLRDGLTFTESPEWNPSPSYLDGFNLGRDICSTPLRDRPALQRYLLEAPTTP
jgi:hypothetical protein